MIKQNRRTHKRSRKHIKKQTRKQRGGAPCIAGRGRYQDAVYNACKSIYSRWPFGVGRSDNWQNGWYLYFNNRGNRRFDQNNHFHLLPDGRVLLTYIDSDGDRQHEEVYCINEDASTQSQVDAIREYIP